MVIKSTLSMINNARPRNGIGYNNFLGGATGGRFEKKIKTFDENPKKKHADINRELWKTQSASQPELSSCPYAYGKISAIDTRKP